MWERWHDHLWERLTFRDFRDLMDLVTSEYFLHLFLLTRSFSWRDVYFALHNQRLEIVRDISPFRGTVPEDELWFFYHLPMRFPLPIGYRFVRYGANGSLQLVSAWYALDQSRDRKQVRLFMDRGSAVIQVPIGPLNDQQLREVSEVIGSRVLRISIERWRGEIAPWRPRWRLKESPGLSTRRSAARGVLEAKIRESAASLVRRCRLRDARPVHRLWVEVRRSCFITPPQESPSLRCCLRPTAESDRYSWWLLDKLRTVWRSARRSEAKGARLRELFELLSAGCPLPLDRASKRARSATVLLAVERAIREQLNAYALVLLLRAPSTWVHVSASNYHPEYSCQNQLEDDNPQPIEPTSLSLQHGRIDLWPCQLLVRMVLLFDHVTAGMLATLGDRLSVPDG